MIDGWVVLGTAFAYVSCLFAIAYIGDWRESRRPATSGRPLIYSLSLAVYCTSWTFFGSVGLASTTGYGFIPIYLGATILMTIGLPLMGRIIRVAKSQNITSIADFIAARYGKSQALASLVTVIAVAGTIPYIALQLKATSASVTALIGPISSASIAAPLGDIAFGVAISMAAFAILFGTRHIDATEHQGGLMLAVAAESIVKLLAFLGVGLFVTFWMFDGFGDLWSRAYASQEIRAVLTDSFDAGRWITITFLSLVCIVLLPRQFHVAVVENYSPRDLRTAAWLFPSYLILINIFVVPIAIAGLLSFPTGSVDADMFVVALPMSVNANGIAMLAFVGGLSAATAMVIVASIALAIMVCNDLVVPFMLRRAATRTPDREDIAEIGPLLLNIRRVVIFLVLMLAYGFHQTIGQSQALASIGLLSFVAIAQFAPAFFIGLFWRRLTATGAIAGISAGFAMWAYTMFLPWIANAGWISTSILEHGPGGIGWLRPESLLGIQTSPLVHGVVCSLVTNLVVFISVSFLRFPLPIERLQATHFVQDDHASTVPSSSSFRLWRTSITVEDLMQTAARYVGAERAERSFTEFAQTQKTPLDVKSEADVQFLRFTEHLLASAIGAASSRLVLSLLLRQGNVGHRSALKLLDDASEAIHYNRDLLQSALDQMGQGISVFDEDLRLICWNRQFRELLQLPPELGRIGVPLDHVFQHKAEAGHYGDVDIETCVTERVHRIAVTNELFHDHNQSDRRVLEIVTHPMPQGGIVTTYTDITDRVEAADALARANESLERRVKERTAQLTGANEALAEAKVKADQANLDKTRFLAAVGHDILQPLNAARLYVSSLTERTSGTNAEELAQNVDASLEAVEEILGALLDISRLDAGAMEPELGAFPLAEIFERLRLEFEPVAAEKNLSLKFVDVDLWARSDRRLVRRVLQNFISNAIKYTPSGKVIVGCRRRDDSILVQVVDSGPGITAQDQEHIFKEFKRLDKDVRNVRGLGLGLSIVQRIGRVLNHPISLKSDAGRGACFGIELPRAEAIVRSVPDISSILPGGGLDDCLVLVVDNEPEIVKSMHLLLTGWGCTVLQAESQEAALREIRNAVRTPDVILADYHLDNTVGTELVSVVRNEIGQDIPTVIITADRSQEVHHEVRDAGCTLLRKPIRPAALRAVIHQLRQKLIAAE